MKKLVNKFFGIGERNFGPYLPPVSNWMVLCGLIDRVLRISLMVMAVLIALKVAGMNDHSWFFVLRPAVLYIVWELLRAVVNAWIRRENARIRKEQLEKWQEEFEANAERNKGYYQDWDEDEDSDDDIEEELYVIKK